MVGQVTSLEFCWKYDVIAAASDTATPHDD